MSDAQIEAEINNIKEVVEQIFWKERAKGNFANTIIMEIARDNESVKNSLGQIVGIIESDIRNRVEGAN